MNHRTHIVGIDPGLVHTGVVNMVLDRDKREILVTDRVVVGPDPVATKDGIILAGLKPHVFIEGYKPRGHLAGDKRMIEAVANIRITTGGKVLLNTGVKQVIRRPLMELLGVWKFSTVTHHQDLRSAARILLYGAVKDERLNALLFDVVLDHVNGRPWYVHT